MMIPEKALNAEAVRGMMLDRMESHLRLKVVAEGSSVEAVCADSCGGVDSLPEVVEKRLTQLKQVGLHATLH